MENKINIAELLKDCPQGMELDCVMYDNLYFDKVSDNKKASYPIFCYITDEKGNRSGISFTKNGYESRRYGAKCVIFPKGKTTWEGFQRPFKDGDIAISENGDIHLLKTSSSSYCAYRDSWEILPKFDSTITANVTIVRLATEEEKEKFFDIIKANGYKWNSETKTLENLIEPKFKLGDMIQDVDKYKVKITEVNLEDECYRCESMITKGIGDIPFKEQNNWELVPNKFDITTLKVFDKVLVRDSGETWCINLFGCYNKTDNQYNCIGNTDIGWDECIPYEGNEHLLGTANDCDEYYKTWE